MVHNNDVDEENARRADGRRPIAGTSQAACDSELIRAYLDGAADAFGEIEQWIRLELWRRYPRLRRELDDLCQTVHQRLFASLKHDRFRGTSRLRGYVVSIAHHAAIDRLRELYRQRALTETWAEGTLADPRNPYGKIEELERKQLLYQVLLNLPAGCRELWRLAYVEKLSYEEIGRRLSIPPGTVKSRMWHCRRKAMKALSRTRRPVP